MKFLIQIWLLSLVFLFPSLCFAQSADSDLRRYQVVQQVYFGEIPSMEMPLGDMMIAYHFNHSLSLAFTNWSKGTSYEPEVYSYSDEDKITGTETGLIRGIREEATQLIDLKYSPWGNGFFSLGLGWMHWGKITVSETKSKFTRTIGNNTYENTDITYTETLQPWTGPALSVGLNHINKRGITFTYLLVVPFTNGTIDKKASSTNSEVSESDLKKEAEKGFTIMESLSTFGGILAIGYTF